MAQRVNNKPTAELERSLGKFSQNEDIMKYSAEKSSKLSSNYTSTQSQKYSTATFEASQSYPEDDRPLRPSQGKYTNFSAYNPPERKKVELLGVKSREQVNYSGNQDVHTFLLSDHQNSVILHSKNKHKEPKMYQLKPTYQDERPIRQNVGIKTLMQAGNAHNSSKKTLKMEENPPAFKNTHSDKLLKTTQKFYKKQNSQSSLYQKDKKKFEKGSQKPNFLKKRSKMSYDPMKAIIEDKNQAFNDTKSVTSASNLKNIKARTDSGLRACISPRTRAEFRKNTGTNSQIVLKNPHK